MAGKSTGIFPFPNFTYFLGSKTKAFVHGVRSDSALLNGETRLSSPACVMGFCSAVPRPLSLFLAGGWRILIAPPKVKIATPSTTTRKNTKISEEQKTREKIEAENPYAGPKNHETQRPKKERKDEKEEKSPRSSELEVCKSRSQCSNAKDVPEEPTGVPHSGQAFISGR